MPDIYIDLWKQSRALVILKIIFDLGRPAQIKEITTLSGGDHETVAKYCFILATMGLLTRVFSKTGWTLTAQGFAFMRPELSTNHPQGDRYPQVIHSSPQNPLLKAESGTYITTTTNTKESVVVEVLSGKSAFYGENLRFFEEIGITSNPQTEFLAEHVEPRVMRAEWKKLSDKGKPWPGLLIKILSSRPKRKTDAERRARYGQWDQERSP